MGKFGIKPVIGVLGGIASGKSAVAAAFEKLGCAVIDADKMAKDLLNEPDVQAKIVDIWGIDILDENKKVDKNKLSRIIFADAKQVDQLTNILHPPVLAQTEKLILKYENQQNTKAIVLDIPLLAEVGWAKRCDVLVFVDTPEQTRHERGSSRGLDEAQIKAREKFQISLDKKAVLADYILNNNSDLSELGKQVYRIFNSFIDA